MSPTQRASTVSGPRRAVKPGPAAAAAPASPAAAPARPARITLNMPPELYRQLQRWAGDAAEALDRPRVGVQDALRAMIRATVSGTAAEAVIGQLRAENGGAN